MGDADADVVNGGVDDERPPLLVASAFLGSVRTALSSGGLARARDRVVDDVEALSDVFRNGAGEADFDVDADWLVGGCGGGC